MANPYTVTQEPDEISLFLHQILLRSSSSSNSPRFHLSDRIAAGPMIPCPGGIHTHGSDFLFPGSAVAVKNGVNRSSSSSNLENEADEYEEYESEEAVTPPAPPPRSSSKRSRAAEVHNLSEKRRRSRINEKMKALQNLIPNSNKTDKASMLDEAIEYLKQLQLQVQMLTMRNGLDRLHHPTSSSVSMDHHNIDWSMNNHFRPPIQQPLHLFHSSPQGIRFEQEANVVQRFEKWRKDEEDERRMKRTNKTPDHLLASFVNGSMFTSQLNM